MPIDHSAIQARIMRALNEQNYDEWETLLTEDYTEWVKTPTFTFVRVEGTGNVGTAAFKARYPSGSLWWVIILYELRGDKVAKSTAFFAPTFEAPDWRKPYVNSKSA